MCGGWGWVGGWGGRVYEGGVLGRWWGCGWVHGWLDVKARSQGWVVEGSAHCEAVHTEAVHMVSRVVEGVSACQVVRVDGVSRAIASWQVSRGGL